MAFAIAVMDKVGTRIEWLLCSDLSGISAARAGHHAPRDLGDSDERSSGENEGEKQSGRWNERRCDQRNSQR